MPSGRKGWLEPLSEIKKRFSNFERKIENIAKIWYNVYENKKESEEVKSNELNC